MFSFLLWHYDMSKIFMELTFFNLYSGDSLSSSAFDPSEFPSLGSRDNNSAPNPALARSNYGKRVV